MTDALLADLRALACASDDGTEYEHNEGCLGEAECPACWAESIRDLIAKHEARTNGDEGVWVVYDHDHGPYPISVWPDAENAARSAAQQGYGRVAYWPFEEEFADAIREWET